MATVGLDFGTHQSKICVEDRSDKNRPRYTFFKFSDLQGEQQIVLPSVVQINNDDTVSYGFVDINRCKETYCKPNSKRPKEPNILKPELILPEKPKYSKLPAKPKIGKEDWKDKLFALTMNRGKSVEMDKWEQECKRLESVYKQDVAKWENECRLKEAEYKERLACYNRAYEDYKLKLAAWEKEASKRELMIYRYFKQATFADFDWQGSISPTILSIWYLAFILFDLENEYGQTFSTQMGIPTGSERFNKNKERAVSVLLSAFRLVEDVYDGDKKAFLSTKYEDLLAKTEFVQYSDERKDEMGILVFPEAYASLMALTTKGRLESGMNLMVDIGGGTTDISFFVIDQLTRRHEPLIYNFHSISKGINYIVEKALNGKHVSMLKHMSLDSNELDKRQLEDAKSIYSDEIRRSCEGLITRLYKNFYVTGLPKENLNVALENRPVVYTGGGSTFSSMRNSIKMFNQVRHMDGYYWQGMYIDDMDKLQKSGLCPILSVALGLSVAQDNDEVRIFSIHDIFKHIKPIKKVEKGIQDDYLLLDD